VINEPPRRPCGPACVRQLEPCERIQMKARSEGFTTQYTRETEERRRAEAAPRRRAMSPMAAAMIVGLLSMGIGHDD